MSKKFIYGRGKDEFYVNPWYSEVHKHPGTDCSEMMSIAWKKYRDGYIFKPGLNKKTIKQAAQTDGYNVLTVSRKESDYVKGTYSKNKTSSEKTKSEKSNNLTRELKKKSDN